MKKQLGLNLIFNTAGSLLFYICQAAINLLVVALAGIEASGVLAVAMTIANVCVSFASYGMRTFQVSDLDHKYSDRTYLLSRQLTVGLAWIGCLLFAFANSYSAEQRWVIALFTGYRLVESWSDIWHGYLQRAERMDIVGISFGVRGLVTAGAITVGLMLTHNLVPTVGILFALNILYVVLVDVPLAKQHADFAAKGKATVFGLLIECFPLAIYASLNTTIGSTPRYFCERILGQEALGFFNAVFVPVLILQVGAVYLFVPFITTFARLWNDRNGKGYRKALRVLHVFQLVLLVCGMVGVAILGRWGLGFLYPTQPKILEYTPLLYVLVVCCILTVESTVLCNLLTICRAMKSLIFGNLAGLAAALVASPVLTPLLDVYGTALATIVGIGVQALTLWLFLQHQCKKQFFQPPEDPESPEAPEEPEQPELPAPAQAPALPAAPEAEEQLPE